MQAFDMDDQTPTEAVVHSVASITGTPAVELPPLFDTVDPDALNQMVGDGGNDVQIKFEYHGVAVTVTPDQVMIQQTVDGERADIGAVS